MGRVALYPGAVSQYSMSAQDVVVLWERLVAGVAVRCESAEWAVRWHTGYPARAVDRHDVTLLCRRFGIAVPEGFEPLEEASTGR